MACLAGIVNSASTPFVLLCIVDMCCKTDVLSNITPVKSLKVHLIEYCKIYEYDVFSSGKSWKTVLKCLYVVVNPDILH